MPAYFTPTCSGINIPRSVKPSGATRNFITIWRGTPPLNVAGSSHQHAIKESAQETEKRLATNPQSRAVANSPPRGRLRPIRAKCGEIIRAGVCTYMDSKKKLRRPFRILTLPAARRGCQVTHCRVRRGAVTSKSSLANKTAAEKWDRATARRTEVSLINIRLHDTNDTTSFGAQTLCQFVSFLPRRRREPSPSPFHASEQIVFFRRRKHVQWVTCV